MFALQSGFRSPLQPSIECCISNKHLPAGTLPCLQAPPTLAAAEATCVLLIYFGAIPNSMPTHSRSWAYSFTGSAEDVVLLSLLRSIAVTVAHALGDGPCFQRCSACRHAFSPAVGSASLASPARLPHVPVMLPGCLSAPFVAGS